MPLEETNPPEPSPVPGVPAPSAEPVTPPETPPAPAEAVPAPETAQPTTPTAQIPPNEPLAPESEPFDSAQDKPIAPEPPSSAASVPTGILHTAPSVAKAMAGTRDFLVKGRVAIQDRKRKKRDKIMLALNTKNKITNDEVEKLLHVSDATATRYLSALEKEGKIIQVGKQGKGILYIKTP